MAGRPPKESIDYAGWDVNIFDSDTKIDKLMEGQGCAGFVVYFFLCQRAYGSNGYFYKWTCDDAATTAKKIGGGVGSESVINTINLCLRIGLFDSDLYARHKIITSRGIQKRFVTVIKDRKHKTVIKEYWLLEKEDECEGLVKVALKPPDKTIMTPVNSIKHPHNSIKHPDNAVKDSKVKDSKVKDSNKGAGAPGGGLDGRQFSDAVKAIVKEWIAYKEEKKQGYKPMGLKNLLTQVENKLKEFPEDRVIYAISDSMACNYQGIIWAKASQPEKPRGRAAQASAKHGNATTAEITRLERVLEKVKQG